MIDGKIGMNSIKNIVCGWPVSGVWKLCKNKNGENAGSFFMLTGSGSRRGSYYPLS